LRRWRRIHSRGGERGGITVTEIGGGADTLTKPVACAQRNAEAGRHSDPDPDPDAEAGRHPCPDPDAESSHRRGAVSAELPRNRFGARGCGASLGSRLFGQLHGVRLRRHRHGRRAQRRRVYGNPYRCWNV
jgi:hypothetical protein